MIFWKNIFKSVAAASLVGAVVEGAHKLYQSYGAVARIDIEGGKSKITKGFFSPRAMAGVQGVVSDIGLICGWIEIKNDGRLVFSDEFPGKTHQRISNIIRNA